MEVTQDMGYWQRCSQRRVQLLGVASVGPGVRYIDSCGIALCGHLCVYTPCSIHCPMCSVGVVVDSYNNQGAHMGVPN